MCNCGNKRNEYAADEKLKFNSSNNSSQLMPSKIFEDSYFKYTGNTGLTVKGNITGKVYRFSKGGEVQLIDYRDASAMFGVPVLQKVAANSR